MPRTDRRQHLLEAIADPNTDKHQRAAAPEDRKRRCAFCLGPVPDGEVVCSAACDDGWFAITPTRDGELWV